MSEVKVCADALRVLAESFSIGNRQAQELAVMARSARLSAGDIPHADQYTTAVNDTAQALQTIAGRFQFLAGATVNAQNNFTTTDQVAASQFCGPPIRSSNGSHP